MPVAQLAIQGVDHKTALAACADGRDHTVQDAVLVNLAGEVAAGVEYVKIDGLFGRHINFYLSKTRASRVILLRA